MPSLTLIGASVRAMAQSAVRGAFSVVAGDRYADQDLLAIAEGVVPLGGDPADCLALLRERPHSPWMYGGAWENHPQVIEEGAQLAPLLGNPANVLRQVRDPWQLAAVLHQHGFLAPPIIASPQDLPQPANSPWLRKAFRSAGGLHVQRWDAESPFSPEEHYLQAEIMGKPCSAIFVSNRTDTSLIGATQQLIGTPWLGADAFRYCGSVGPLRFPRQAERELHRLGTLLAREFGLVGIWGVDFIWSAETDEGPIWPLEINPRYTASVEILERAQGVSAVAWHVAACTEGSLPRLPTHSSGKLWGKGILFAPAGLRVPLAWQAQAGVGSSEEWPRFADLPAPKSEIPSRAPILTCFASGNNVEEVTRHLRAAARRTASALGMSEPATASD